MIETFTWTGPETCRQPHSDFSLGGMWLTCRMTVVSVHNPHLFFSVSSQKFTVSVLIA